MRDMRILLAGATGAVGRLLVPLLLERGHEVLGSTRSTTGFEQVLKLGAKPLLMDALDRSGVLETVASVAPDVIIHQLTSLAGGSPQDNARIRREGTRNLVDAALAAHTPRLIAQSIAWAYAPGDGLAVESDPLDLQAAEPRLTSVRGVEALENAVAEVAESVVLRYGAFYGPGTWYEPGGLIAERIRAGNLPANDAVTSFLHVRDAAVAAREALAWPRGSYNVVDDEPAPAREWVPAFARAVSVPVPEPSQGRAGWERGASNARARALGFRLQFPSWRAGFAELSSRAG